MTKLTCPHCYRDIELTAKPIVEAVKPKMLKRQAAVDQVKVKAEKEPTFRTNTDAGLLRKVLWKMGLKHDDHMFNDKRESGRRIKAYVARGLSDQTKVQLTLAVQTAFGDRCARVEFVRPTPGKFSWLRVPYMAVFLKD